MGTRPEETLGGQCDVTSDDEQYLVSGLMKCSEWSFPLKRADVKNTGRNFLNCSDRIEKRFVNSKSGKE